MVRVKPNLGGFRTVWQRQANLVTGDSGGAFGVAVPTPVSGLCRPLRCPAGDVTALPFMYGAFFTGHSHPDSGSLTPLRTRPRGVSLSIWRCAIQAGPDRCTYGGAGRLPPDVLVSVRVSVRAVEVAPSLNHPKGFS